MKENGLVDRLRSCPELMEKMGIDITNDPNPCIYVFRAALHGTASDVHFDNDDCPGSALFVVRGLKALHEANCVPHLRAYNNCWWCGEDWQNTALPLTPTITQAVAEALIAVFCDVIPSEG